MSRRAHIGTRIAGLTAGVLLVIATVTSGLAVRCGMAVHCDLCPTAATQIAPAVDCPEMLPAAPVFADVEVRDQPPSVLVSSLAALMAAREPTSGPTLGLDATRSPDERRPPGGRGPILVLRI